MLKKSLIGVILLLVGSAQASSHKRLDSILSTAYTLAGISPGGNAQMPDSVAIPYVNLAIQEVTTQFPAVVKYGSDTLVVTDPRVSVDSTFEKLLFCRLRRNTQSPTSPGFLSVLMIVPEDSVYEYIPGHREEGGKGESEPGYVWMSGGYLHIHTEPIRADWIYFGYTASGLKLTSASDTTDVRPRYRKLVVLLTARSICQDLEKFAKADRLAAEIAIEQLRLGR